MKQLWIEDDIHEELIKEAGRRMLIGGKRMTLGQVANELIMEAISNSNPPTAGEKPIELADSVHLDMPSAIELDKKQDGEQKPNASAFDFSALDD